MNHIYKVIWCTASQTWLVVSELAASHRKNTNTTLKLMSLASVLGWGSWAHADPTVISKQTTAPITEQKGTDFLVKNTSIDIDTAQYNGDREAIGLSLSSGNEALNVKVDGLDVTLKPGADSLDKFVGLKTSSDKGVKVDLTGVNRFILDNAGAQAAIWAISNESSPIGGNVNIEVNISGQLDINHQGNKAVDESHGIQLEAKSGDIILKHKGQGLIETQSGSAIAVKHAGESGGIDIEVGAVDADKKAIRLVTYGDSSTWSHDKGHHGISAILDYPGISNPTPGGITMTSNASIETHGKGAFGLYAFSRGDDNTEIYNTGDILTHGGYANGIHVHASRALGWVKAENDGKIITEGQNSTGIFAQQDGDGGIYIKNDGDVEVKGSQSRAMVAMRNSSNLGQIELENNGQLTTHNGTALQAMNRGGGVFVLHRGGIDTKNTLNGSSDAHGIDVSAKGKVDIILEKAHITVENNSSDKTAHGIFVTTSDVEKTATVDIRDGSIVDASKGDSGVFLKTQQSSGALYLSKGSKIIGGKGAAVDLDFNGTVPLHQYMIDNQESSISAKNDRVIRINWRKEGDSSVLIHNDGVITGYIEATNHALDNTQKHVELYNGSGATWWLRHQDDDTKKVAISKFSQGKVENHGLIAIAKNTATQTDGTNEYVVKGTASIDGDGIEHAYLLGVNEFRHHGILDLRGSGQSGNLMVIGGGNKAGQYGKGTFYSEGGILRVTTLLNEGGGNSRSDMLVVDDLKLGDAGLATSLEVTIAPDSKKDIATKESGIQIVKTLGTQEDGVFELLDPVTYGRYEYKLYSHNGQGVKDGYYLRNQLIDGGGSVKPEIVYFRNPNVGAHLANQYSAANMFQQNLADRKYGRIQAGQNAWAKLVQEQIKSEHMQGTQNSKTNLSVLQVGSDLYHNDKGYTAGAFIGYGKSDTKNTSKLTRTQAKSDVEGMQIGGYMSWMPNEAQGPYVDLWGHVANYRNHLKGKAQKNRKQSYDGHGWALSAEGGYAINIQQHGDTQWVWKPYTQLTYGYVKMDDFTDSNNTRFSHNKNQGIQAKVGSRIYGYKTVEGKNSILPYAEINWLHNGMSNEAKVNGDNEKGDLGKNIGEIKVGLEGQLGKSSSLFAHLGLQKGSHAYQRKSAQLGYTYRWK